MRRADSSDEATWTQVGTSTLVLSPTAYAGLAVTSHDPSTSMTATFDNALVGWFSQDIGAVGPPGSVVKINNDSGFGITAAGSDIWGTADSFHYVWKPLTTNTTHTIDAEVSTLQATSPYAKAGVMIRESTAPDAAEAILDVKPDGSLEFMVRNAEGESTSFVAGAAAGIPVWLRITLSGQTVTAQTTADPGGDPWITVGTATVNFSPAALIGLAVTSHDPTTVTSATFFTVGIDP